MDAKIVFFDNKMLFFLIIFSFQLFVINTNVYRTNSFSIAKPLQLSPGTMAPDFTLTDIMTEETFSLSDFQNKVVILDFFAIWCPPCKAAIPDMRKIYYDYSTEELAIISIDIEPSEEKDLVLSFAIDYQMEWFVTLDNDSIVWENYGTGYIPTMYIIGQDQRIAYSEIGFNYENVLNTLDGLGLESSATTTSDGDGSPSVEPLVILGILSIVPIVGLVIVIVVKFSEKAASRDLKSPSPWKSKSDIPQIQHGIQFCHNCGNKADLSDRFCINCGNRLD